MSHAAPRPSGLGRGAVGLAVAFITAITGTVLVAPAHASAATRPASQALVVLSEDHPARSRPDADAHRIESVPARRPLTGVRTVLPVLGRSTDGSGSSWVQVRLPGRPNGHKGWISARHTRGTFTEWQISVKLSTRRVIVYRQGRVARRFPAVVGKPSTPTPRGHFFIEEAIALSPFAAGGPFALATSARSNVLQEFEGGPGQIALHGTDNLSGSPGTAVSHGCIRVNTSAITWLARRIGGGVPLTITR
jgi:lipoprotein-anchoring transpeptidase ErfK/SrfK